MLAKCHVCRVGQRCPTSVTLPWCWHSGVNAIFCTLFNGSAGTCMPDSGRFGLLPPPSAEAPIYSVMIHPFFMPDPCLEPEMLAKCHVCRVGQRCPTSVTLPWCWHSGVNAIFCTLFNGSAGTCMPDSGRFGLLPPPSAEAPIYSVMIHPFFMSARAGTITVQPSRRDDP